jgi:hypothetical protein
MTEVVTQGYTPQADRVMRATARRNDGEFEIPGRNSSVQTRDEVGRQEWTIPRRAYDPRRNWALPRGPIQGRKNTGKRSGKSFDIVGNDRQAEGQKAPDVAIRIDDQAFALRREPINDVLDYRAAADPAQRLVASANALSAAAG